MGINSSQEIQSEKQQFRALSHPYFKNYKQAKDQNGQYLEIVYALTNQQEYANWKITFERAPTLQSLMLPISSTYLDNGLCGSNGFAKIKYPNYPYLLHEQIANRKRHSFRHFEQAELWYLTYTLIQAASIMHDSGTKAGDIRPSNIFLNNDGEIKVGCIFSWPKERINYTKTLSKKQITYLAPQQMKDLKFGRMSCTTNFELAQSFSIGLTILDSAILQESGSLYLIKLGFNYEQLMKKLFKLMEVKYSPVLKMLIANLCEINPNHRLFSRQLLKWLKPYQQQLINLKPFLFKSIPDQLVKSFQKLQQMIITFNNSQNQIKQNKKIPYEVNYHHMNQVQHLKSSSQRTYQFQQANYSNSFNEGHSKNSNKKDQTTSKRLDTIQQQSSICSQMTKKNSQLDIKQYFSSETVHNHPFNLEEIDRQLQRSKRLFPS